MVDPVLYGADYSVYVRIARMTLAEKGVRYRLDPVDVFAPDGLPAPVPFQRTRVDRSLPKPQKGSGGREGVLLLSVSAEPA